jgi:fission process protein 1
MAGLQATKSKADDLADKNVDSTDTELRYAAYGARLRTALRASHRYLAYVLHLFPHLHYLQR